MRLSNETIQRVQATADVLEVVEGYLTLKKKGTNWWALSPFTDEKTPSFSVNPQKGIYKCFSTGKGGDAISFVMEMEGINFLEAIRFLAKKYNIPIEEETTDTKEEETIRESLLIALNFAKNHYQTLLSSHPDGQSLGYSYFKERGFAPETIQKFELGYSLDQWDGFFKEAVSKGYNPEILEAAGLIIQKEGENKRYDRFRGRVMFPIHNVSGRVIGFGARTLKKDDKPKYLNSPESEVYHKSFVLYGFFQAKNAIRSQDNCYLVEGYTDVISLHQAGIENVVASSGTSLTEDQIKLISRFTQNITILYDGDVAGIKASLRGIDLILEKGLDVRVATFPDGDDPDSYVRKVGGAAFKQYLAEHVQDFILYRTQLGLDEVQGDPIKKANLIRDLVASISKMPDAIKRTVFFQQCSKLLGVDEDILVAEGNKIFYEKEKKQQQSARAAAEETAVIPDVPEKLLGKVTAASQEDALILEGKHFQEQESIRILLEYGHVEVEDGQRIGDFLLQEIAEIEFDHPAYREILQLYRAAVRQGTYPKPEYFLKSEQVSVKNMVVDLITEKSSVSKNWYERHGIFVPTKDESLDTVLYTNILRLKYRAVKRLCQQSLKMMETAEKLHEISEAQQVYLTLKQEENRLAKALGIVYS